MQPITNRCQIRVPVTNMRAPPATATTMVDPKSGSAASSAIITPSPMEGYSAPFRN